MNTRHLDVIDRGGGWLLVKCAEHPAWAHKQQGDALLREAAEASLTLHVMASLRFEWRYWDGTV